VKAVFGPDNQGAYFYQLFTEPINAGDDFQLNAGICGSVFFTTNGSRQP